METILVTGACGGIGSRLVPHLLKLGYRVIALDNLYSGSWQNLDRSQINLKSIQIDISNSELVDRTFRGVDFQYCIHLAAISSLPECQVNPIQATKVNFLGTVTISELCSKQKNFKRFIFASTSAVYEGVEEELLTENLAVDPYLVYPQTKLFSENYLRSAFKTRSFPIVIVRLFNVFGDRQNAIRQSPPLINYLVRELSENRSPQLYGWHAPGRDYVSVNSVVGYISKILTMDASTGRTLNLCSEQTLNVQDIYKIVSSTLDVSLSPELHSPGELWGSYTELSEGLFPLDSHYIEKETNKYSKGSASELKELFELDSLPDPRIEIPDTVRAIKAHLDLSKK